MNDNINNISLRPMGKAKKEVRLKTEEIRRAEIDCIMDKLTMLDIGHIIPQEITEKIEDHIKNGTNYYVKHPWPEMNRIIELILNNKLSIQNRMNLLYSPH